MALLLDFVVLAAEGAVLAIVVAPVVVVVPLAEVVLVFGTPDLFLAFRLG